MDFTEAYCPTLEENGWWLTTRLATLSCRLVQQIGRSHTVFLEIQQECAVTKLAISETRQELDEHWHQHGC